MSKAPTDITTSHAPGPVTSTAPPADAPAGPAIAVPTPVPGTATGRAVNGDRTATASSAVPADATAPEGAPPGHAGPTAPAPTSGPPDPDPGPGRRRINWRQALWAGLTCFAVWLLLDAPTLQRSAQAAPFGVRRTVALDVLGPVAALSRALGLSHVEGAADRVLGRTGGSVVTGAGPGGAPPPPVSPLSGVLLRPVAAGRHHPAPSTGPAPLPTPTAAAPLGVLVIGDSIGIDLGNALVDELAQTGVVHAELDGRVDTGLSRPDYFNWPAELAADLQRYHPEVVVVMIGANDPQNLVVNGQAVGYGSRAWDADYGARVAGVMKQIVSSGARGLWIGMPPMADPTLNGEMRTLDTIFAEQATRHRGVDYLSSWSVLSTRQGGFATYLPDASGAEVDVRTPDGTHLAPGGASLLADDVVRTMNGRWGLHLHP